MIAFHESNLTLVVNEAYPYEIDLEEMNSSGEVLDMIAQISRKTWATNEMIGELAKMLDHTLNLQANVCSFGSNKIFDPTKWLNSKKGKKYRQQFFEHGGWR